MNLVVFSSVIYSRDSYSHYNTLYKHHVLDDAQQKTHMQSFFNKFLLF